MKCALIRTRDGVLWAHGFCTFEVEPGQTMLDVPDEFAHAPRRWRYVDGGWLPYQEPMPDGRGFEMAVKTVFANEPRAINRLLAKYPLFLWSLRDQNWPYVEAILKAALNAADLTQAQYDMIMQAASDHRIPATL